MTGSTPTPFGFAGQAGYQTDSDTGLKLLGDRYYDSSTGRFISRDPIRDGDNWYAYCANDPVNGLDSEGLDVGFASNGDGRNPYGSDWGNHDYVDWDEPKGPPNVSLWANGAVASQHTLEPFWFKEQVQKGGPGDYKSNGPGDINGNPEYQDYGNFHYGYVGATAGFPTDVLEAEAGRAQQHDNQQTWPGTPGFPGFAQRNSLCHPTRSSTLRR